MEYFEIEEINSLNRREQEIKRFTQISFPGIII